MERYTFSLQVDEEGDFYSITDNDTHKLLTTTTSYGDAELITKALNYNDKHNSEQNG